MQDVFTASITLLIAFAVSIIYYKKLEPKWLRFFPWFLLFSFLMQVAGSLYSSHFKKSNHFIFNIYMLIGNEFYFLVFYKALSKKILKNVAFISGLIFILYYYYNIVVLNSFFVFSSYTNDLGELLVLLCCLLYLAELLTLNKIVNYFKIPMFWITTGIMISIVGDFLYLGFLDYILRNNLDPQGNIYVLIFTSLNLIEYGLFTIGFLCKRVWKITR